MEVENLLPLFFVILRTYLRGKGGSISESTFAVQAFLDLGYLCGDKYVKKNAESENRINQGYLVVLKGRKIG